MQSFAKKFAREFGPDWLDHKSLAEMAKSYSASSPPEIQTQVDRLTKADKKDLVHYLLNDGRKIWSAFRRDLALEIYDRDHSPLHRRERVRFEKKVELIFSEARQKANLTALSAAKKDRSNLSTAFLCVGSLILVTMIGCLPKYATMATTEIAEDKISKAQQELQSTLAALKGVAGTSVNDSASNPATLPALVQSFKDLPADCRSVKENAGNLASSLLMLSTLTSQVEESVKTIKSQIEQQQIPDIVKELKDALAGVKSTKVAFQ